MLKQLLLSYFYKGVIYQIINIQNRKSYIGKTINKDLKKYINDHFKNALNKNKRSKEKYFYNAIRKYGKENFKIVVLGEIYSENLEDLNKKLNEAEIDCIFHFRTFSVDDNHFDAIYGYNMTKGGDGSDTFSGLSIEKKERIREEKRKKAIGRRHTAETKKKMSENHPKPWLNKKQPKEMIENRVSKLRGKTSKRKGTKNSKEANIKISKNHAHYWKGKHHKNETIQKIRKKRASQDMAYRYATYYLKNANNDLIIVKNVTKFLEENKLSKTQFYKLLHGERDNYKGYKINKEI